MQAERNRDERESSHNLNDYQVEFHELPSGLAKAPFNWQHLGNKYPMNFLGGFVGVRQNPIDLCLRPEIGWAIQEVVVQ
jgi:Domain of unknown function (DUF4419)